MVQPELRRASDPRIARKLHLAIKKICDQKQSPIFDRVFRALTIDKVQLTRSRVEIQLKNCVQDGIILESSNNRASLSGSSDKASYRVPSIRNFQESYEDDGHDWYCWVCHREGEMFSCSHCPRVFHQKCTEISSDDLPDEFVCYCCTDLETTKQYGEKELQELAVMLAFTVERMKSKCEELWSSPRDNLEPTYHLFIYNDSSLLEIEKRVKQQEFDSLAKFHYEIEWLFHNAVIFHGADHKLAELARMVVLDGQNELGEIDLCSECYINSNKRQRHWFSQPCIREQHRIVYAKLGSDPHWPAKVIQQNEDNTSIDVRFFGPPYQRAWLPIRNILDLKDKPVNRKRPKALIQAENELMIYNKLLKAMKTNKKTSLLDDLDSTEEEIEDVDDQDEKDDCDEDDDDEYYHPVKKSCNISKEENRLNNNNDCSSKKKPRKQKHLRNIETSKKREDDISKSEDATSLAQQIKMTDDYKMIAKLQVQVRTLQQALEKSEEEHQNAQSSLESALNDLNVEKQKNAYLQDKGADISMEKLRNEMMLKRQDELDAAVEEEHKRNEMEFEVRLKEALVEERATAEVKLQEALEKEHAQIDERVKVLNQRERDEVKRNFDRYKHDLDVKHKRTLEETVHKLKLESEELSKRMLQESMMRLQVDTERMVAATKKKSWCSNCAKEAFYHCCWNTDYCSTECQRVHWVSHRYQCSREMTSSTCRSCQQRQTYPPTNFSPQIPPK